VFEGFSYSLGRGILRSWTFALRSSKKFAVVANLVPAASLRHYLTTTLPFMPICSWPSIGQYMS
jgi:hypothetical protein